MNYYVIELSQEKDGRAVGRCYVAGADGIDSPTPAPVRVISQHEKAEDAQSAARQMNGESDWRAVRRANRVAAG